MQCKKTSFFSSHLPLIALSSAVVFAPQLALAAGKIAAVRQYVSELNQDKNSETPVEVVTLVTAEELGRFNDRRKSKKSQRIQLRSSAEPIHYEALSNESAKHVVNGEIMTAKEISDALKEKLNSNSAKLTELKTKESTTLKYRGLTFTYRLNGSFTEVIDAEQKIGESVVGWFSAEEQSAENTVESFVEEQFRNDSRFREAFETATERYEEAITEFAKHSNLLITKNSLKPSTTTQAVNQNTNTYLKVGIPGEKNKIISLKTHKAYEKAFLRGEVSIAPFVRTLLPQGGYALISLVDGRSRSTTIAMTTEQRKDRALKAIRVAFGQYPELRERFETLPETEEMKFRTEVGNVAISRSGVLRFLPDEAEKKTATEPEVESKSTSKTDPFPNKEAPSKKSRPSSSNYSEMITLQSGVKVSRLVLRNRLLGIIARNDDLYPRYNAGERVQVSYQGHTFEVGRESLIEVTPTENSEMRAKSSLERRARNYILSNAETRTSFESGETVEILFEDHLISASQKDGIKAEAMPPLPALPESVKSQEARHRELQNALLKIIFTNEAKTAAHENEEPVELEYLGKRYLFNPDLSFTEIEATEVITELTDAEIEAHSPQSPPPLPPSSQNAEITEILGDADFEEIRTTPPALPESQKKSAHHRLTEELKTNTQLRKTLSHRARQFLQAEKDYEQLNQEMVKARNQFSKTAPESKEREAIETFMNEAMEKLYELQAILDAKELPLTLADGTHILADLGTGQVKLDTAKKESKEMSNDDSATESIADQDTTPEERQAREAEAARSMARQQVEAAIKGLEAPLPVSLAPKQAQSESEAAQPKRFIEKVLGLTHRFMPPGSKAYTRVAERLSQLEKTRLAEDAAKKEPAEKEQVEVELTEAEVKTKLEVLSPEAQEVFNDKIHAFNDLKSTYESKLRELFQKGGTEAVHEHRSFATGAKAFLGNAGAIREELFQSVEYLSEIDQLVKLLDRESLEDGIPLETATKVIHEVRANFTRRAQQINQFVAFIRQAAPHLDQETRVRSQEALARTYRHMSYQQEYIALIAKKTVQSRKTVMKQFVREAGISTLAGTGLYSVVSMIAGNFTSGPSIAAAIGGAALTIGGTIYAAHRVAKVEKKLAVGDKNMEAEVLSQFYLDPGPMNEDGFAAERPEDHKETWGEGSKDFETFTKSKGKARWLALTHLGARGKMLNCELSLGAFSP